MKSSTATRPLSPGVRDKLRKLLPLLASNHDGERTATVAAIDRVLKAAGLDWFDFTDAIATPSASPPPPPPPPPPKREAPQSKADGENIDADGLRALIGMLRERRKFNAKTEEFLDCMLWRAKNYSTVYVSKKQWRWLCDLGAKAGL